VDTNCSIVLHIGNVPHHGAVAPQSHPFAFVWQKAIPKGKKWIKILQTGKRAHRHHADRHGSRENIWGESSTEWGGVLEGVSPPQPTRGLGSVVSSPFGSGAKPQPETHFGIV